MSAQTTYQYQTPKGVAGGLFDISPYSIDSRLNAEKGYNTLKFGMGAMQGTTPGVDVLIPVESDTAATFEGLVLTGFTSEMNMAGEVQVFSGQTVGILRWGKAWARIDPDVTPQYGESLYLINEGAKAGLFTNDETAGFAVNGRFMGTVGTGAIAPVELYNQKNV